MTECNCGRGEYDPGKYHTCYECYRERRAQYIDCIFCGRWHSPKYATCYKCRDLPYRDEAARNLRYDILIRDGFCCRACGSYEQPEVDHIKPCAKAGEATPWNLQVLCHDCNQDKGSDWDEKRWEPTRIELMRLYLTYGWRFLEADQQTRLVEESMKYGVLRQYAHVSAPRDLPEWVLAIADSDAG